MAFNLFQDPQQGAGFVICVVTPPICIVATVLRFLATKRSRRKIGWEDGSALIALAFFLIYVFMFLYLLVTMNGRTLQELALLPPDVLRHILQVGWIMSPQYVANQLFTKLSLFLLYHRLFSIDETFVLCLYTLVGIQTCWSIANYVTKLLLCLPIQSIWDRTLPGTCINIPVYLAASETVNSLVDFAMIGLAIWIVQSMRLDRATKWKLSFLFSLGGVSGVIGFIKIGEAYMSAYTNILDPIWDILQMATSIICCCAPIYRSLLFDLKIVKVLKAKLESFMSSRRSNHSDSPPESRMSSSKQSV